MFGGETPVCPRVPGTAIKNTCLTVYIVLLGFSYWIFESPGMLFGSMTAQLKAPGFQTDFIYG